MGMRKKMKLFITMVSVGTLLGAMPVMAAEQPELPTKVQDIANGSDDIYGEGVPIEHGANPDERFSSGGVDHTHQYIIANALTILSNDQGNSTFNGELNSSILMEATDWPDKLGNETDAGTFAGHFYDPDSGKNWLGQTSPTARTRAESYFKSAVDAYHSGDVQLAMSNLGKGTHYVSDLNEPHHASNLTAVNSNHSAFEKYVDKNRKSYTIAGNSFSESVYTTAVNTSTGDLFEKEGHFYVYFNRKECPYCDNIEDDIKQFKKENAVYEIDAEACKGTRNYDWDSHEKKYDVEIGEKDSTRKIVFYDGLDENLIKEKYPPIHYKIIWANENYAALHEGKEAGKVYAISTHPNIKKEELSEKKFVLGGVPTLVEFENHKVINFYFDDKEIIDFLESDTQPLDKYWNLD